MKKRTLTVALAFALGLGGAMISAVSKAKAADSSCPSPDCNGGNVKCCSNSSGATFYKNH